MRNLLLTALLATAAFAGSPSTKRMSVLVVPMDKASEAVALKIEGYANDAVREFPAFELRTSDDLFGIAPDEEAAASLKRAEQGFDESRAAFDEKNFEDAERKLRATIKEFQKAAPAMKACGHLCDALAMYAASLQSRGDVEEAKIAILDLLALQPKFEPDKKRFPQDFLALKLQVQGSRNASLRGNVTVKSRPAGARVFLNGEFQGHTPTTLQTIPIGKNLVRLERPGFVATGTIVEITPEDQEWSRDLVATNGYKAWDALMDRLATEAIKDKAGQAFTSTANALKLDRALVAVVKTQEGSGTFDLDLIYVDLKKQDRLSAKRTSFQGEEYGQLKGEVGRLVNACLNNAEGTEARSGSSDPLEDRHGMDEWNAEDKGGRTTHRNKKSKGGDPLEGRNGTEDW